MTATVDRLLGEGLRRKPRTHAYVAVDLPDIISRGLSVWVGQHIPDKDLYKRKGTFGRETKPHVTVKWGLRSLDCSPELRQLVKQAKPFAIQLGLVDVFKGNEFDVVKLNVVGAGLNRLHAALSTFPNDDERKPGEYKPHVTLAYVKPGAADDLVGRRVVPDAFSTLVVDKLRHAGEYDDSTLDLDSSRPRVGKQRGS